MRFFTRMGTSPWLLLPALGLLLLAASLLESGILQPLEYPVYDGLLTLRPALSQERVTLIAIDQRSRRDFAGDLEAPETLAAMLRQVQRLGAAGTGLLQPLPVNPDQASRLLNAIDPSKVVLTLAASRQPTSQQSKPPAALTIPDIPFTAVSRHQPAYLQNPLAPWRQQRPQSGGFQLPRADALAEAGRAGHLLFSPDSDGRVRNLALLTPWADRLLPALPLQLALQAAHLNSDQLQHPPSVTNGALTAVGIQIPVHGFFRSLLDFSGQHRPFQTVSASDLLANRLPANSLQGRTVLIGPTDGFGDRQRVPGFGTVSTSELAAWATATLLAGSPLQRPPWAWLAEAGVQLYFILLLLLLIPRLSLRAGSTTLALFLSGWILFAACALVFAGIWLKIIPAVLFCSGGFLLLRRQHGLTELDQHRQESTRLLAQRFQEQGLLDLALEKALLLKPGAKANREIIYTIGLECERKRSPQNAATAYRHLLQGGRFRDCASRLKQLDQDNGTVTLARTDATLVLEKPGEKPTLGRYRIEQELGQGAMGVVYLGIDPKINRQVAIKILPYQNIEPNLLGSVKERFFREAEAIGQLNHPNLVAIYDIGEEKDLAFLAMERLTGKDLSHYCTAGKLLPVPEVVDIVAQVASGLACAHEQGIVHRDIKPANLFLQDNGQVKVTDFGIARFTAASATETGIVLGTPNYMSPEQIAGKKIDGRSDLFSLGVVMYELLSGCKPFQGDNITTLMFNITHGNYPPLQEVSPKLPAAIYPLVSKLIQKNLTRRFKTAAALYQELDELRKELGQG